MSLTIDELTTWEEQLIDQIHRSFGPMEQRTNQLMEANVFGQYYQIHQNYALLAQEGNNEALKRAVFIQWYGVSEPGCYSGIPGTNSWGGGKGLNTVTERNILKLAERLILSDNTDAEFQWMMAWYYLISDFYFEHFLGDLSPLVIKLRLLNQTRKLWSDGVPSEAVLTGRGQMSDYWLSIRKNHCC